MKNLRDNMKIKPVSFRLELEPTDDPTADRLRAVLAAFQSLIPILKRVRPWGDTSREELFILNQILVNGSMLLRAMLSARGVEVFNIQTDAEEVLKVIQPDPPENLSAEKPDPDGTGIIDADGPAPER